MSITRVLGAIGASFRFREICTPFILELSGWLRCWRRFNLPKASSCALAPGAQIVLSFLWYVARWYAWLQYMQRLPQPVGRFTRSNRVYSPTPGTKRARTTPVVWELKPPFSSAWVNTNSQNVLTPGSFVKSLENVRASVDSRKGIRKSIWVVGFIH